MRFVLLGIIYNHMYNSRQNETISFLNKAEFRTEVGQRVWSQSKWQLR